AVMHPRFRRVTQWHPSPAGDADRDRGAGDIRDGHAEFPWTPRESLHCAADVLHPPESMEQIVKLLGVAKLFPFACRCADPVESGQGIRVDEREVDVHERIAVAEVAGRFVAVMEADRDLRA